MKAATNNKEIVMSSSVRVGFPLDSALDGCDYCYRLSRILVPVDLVPHLGRPGRACESCRAEIAKMATVEAVA